MKTVMVAVLVLGSTCSQVKADDCVSYPYVQGTNVEDVNGGTKIVATAAESVSFDDVDSVKDARDEATLEAKTLIAKFLSEGVKSDEAIIKAVQETKSMQGDSKTAVRNEVVNRIKKLSSSSQALLRGVVVLGECYTKGKELRVSVGIKPETISSAANLANGVSNSLAGTSPTGDTATPSNANKGLDGVDAYSDTKRLDKF